MKARILELSHRHKLGHLSSNLTTAEILEPIFAFNPKAFVVLSSGHAGLALYVALEKYASQDAEALLKQHGSQPHLNYPQGIYATSGSLGQGLTVAVGYALARRDRIVHCVISDGECAEGCVWEALAFIRNAGLRNLQVHVNLNGYSALSAVDTDYLVTRLKAFLPCIALHHTNSNQFPFLRGLHAHYKVMTDADYGAAMQIIEQDNLKPTGCTSMYKPHD